jgi:hypothetical protein
VTGDLPASGQGKEMAMSKDQAGNTNAPQPKPEPNLVDTRAAEEADAAKRDAESEAAERAAREETFSRRALLQAGWTVPVIVAVGLRETAHASPHADRSHADVRGHADVHADVRVHADLRHSDRGY